jgi:hypothetical protein
MQEFCIVSTKCLCYTAFSSQNQIRKGLVLLHLKERKGKEQHLELPVPHAFYSEQRRE